MRMHTRRSIVFAATLASSLAFGAPAVGAAQREREGQPQGQARARSGADRERPQPQARQSEPQRSAPPARQPRPQGTEPAPRTTPDDRQARPMPDRQVRPPSSAPGRSIPDARDRQNDPRYGSSDNRYRSNDPRSGANDSRYRPSQNYAVRRAVPRFDGRWSGRPPSIIVSRPAHVYQPYYVFRPRTSFSFGLSIGYPVAFPGWYDPFRYDGYYYT